MTYSNSIRTIHDGNAIRILIGDIFIKESDIITIVSLEDNITMHGKNWRVFKGFLYGLKVSYKNSEESDSDDDDPCSFAVGINDIKEIYNKDGNQIYSKNN